jgi:spermidine synthase
MIVWDWKSQARAMKEIDRRQGKFGEILVKERLRDGARLYCVGDSVQTMTAPDGTSLFGYVHATKMLLGEVTDVLMLGGGGGSLATMLTRRGVNVTVVDIDPVAEDLARRHFGLDPRVTWITQDARVFLNACPFKFDGLVIDTCDARGALEEFATPASLVDSFRVLRSNGAIVLNLASDGEPRHYSWQLASAMVANGYNATLYRPCMGSEGNELLHVPANGPRPSLKLGDLNERPRETRLYLLSLDAFVPRETKPIGAPYWRTA